MANHASAKKRIRQIKKRTAHNRHIRSTVRTAIRQARAAVENGDENATQALRKAEVLIRKAVSKGVYHPRAGSRYISRLVHRASQAA